SQRRRDRRARALPLGARRFASFPQRPRSRDIRRDPRSPGLRRADRASPDLRPEAAVARRDRGLGRRLAAFGVPPPPVAGAVREVLGRLSGGALPPRPRREAVLLHVPPHPGESEKAAIVIG